MPPELQLPAALLAESYRLINQARVIAEAPAAQTAQIGHAHPSSAAPPGAFTHTTSTLDALGARINTAIKTGSATELLAANQWAAEELHRLRHYPGAGAETPEQFRFRVCAQYEGQTASAVARRELTSITTVRKLRAEDGRDAARGHKLADEPSSS